MIDEGHAVLDVDGTLSPADLDLALVRHGGFPRAAGGPFFLAGILGIARVPRTGSTSNATTRSPA